MGDTIKLPPLPTHPTNGLRQWWTPDQLRARDLEVARLVLEAAINACDMPAPWHHYATASEAQQAIRALEFHHG